MRKIPMRKCVATQEQLPKKELIRIVRTPQMEVKIDETGRMNGRGAYLKRSVDAVAPAQKRQSLTRSPISASRAEPTDSPSDMRGRRDGIAGEEDRARPAPP